MADIYLLILICISIAAGIAHMLHAMILWKKMQDDREWRRVHEAAHNLRREPWRETPELGSGKHRRLDYSDISFEEDKS